VLVCWCVGVSLCRCGAFSLLLRCCVALLPWCCVAVSMRRYDALSHRITYRSSHQTGSISRTASNRSSFSKEYAGVSKHEQLYLSALDRNRETDVWRAQWQEDLQQGSGIDSMLMLPLFSVVNLCLFALVCGDMRSSRRICSKVLRSILC
jgi:hypothetical protein